MFFQNISQQILKFIKNNKREVLVVTFITFAGWIIYTLISSFTSPPKILTLTPINEEKNVDPSLPIILTTNKSVKSEDFSISSTPEATFIIKKDQDKTYSFTPSPSLHTNSKYAIFISYKNKKIAATSFETIKSESDPTILEQASKFMKDNYPLAAFLPIIEDEYELYYSKGNTLSVAVFNKSLSDVEAKKIALDFLKEHSLTEKDHSIVIIDGDNFPNVTKVETEDN